MHGEYALNESNALRGVLGVRHVGSANTVCERQQLAINNDNQCMGGCVCVCVCVEGVFLAR
jgi:hypothetical protein